MEATEMETLSKLADVVVPTNEDTAKGWAARELSEFGLIENWRDVCRILGIPTNVTLSGIETLKRAIAREKKKAGKVFDQGSLFDEEATVSKPVTPAKKPVVPVLGQDALAQMIAGYIQPYLELQAEQSIDESKVNELIEKALANRWKGIEVFRADQESVKLEGLFHSKQPEVIKWLSHVNRYGARKCVYMYGPAGTGKSVMGKLAAEAMGLEFVCQSFCLQSPKSELTGYMTATGEYIGTAFRTLYENGGLYMLDEVDAANPQILLVLNNGLAGNQMLFPDGKMVKRHADFNCVAAANTFGSGGNALYKRNALDAASSDRFKIMAIDYDNDLEASLFDKKFCQPVWKAREILKDQTGWVLSTRAIDRFEAAFDIYGNMKEAFAEGVLCNLEPQFRTNLLNLV